MDRAHALLFALLGVAVASCATTPRPYLTPSEALARASELDGKRVTIGGVVDLGTNSRCLYDSLQAIKARKGDGARVVTLSEGDRLLERKGELNHRSVMVSGTFKRTFNEPGTLDLYQCNTAGIDQETIRLNER